MSVFNMEKIYPDLQKTNQTTVNECFVLKCPCDKK